MKRCRGSQNIRKLDSGQGTQEYACHRRRASQPGRRRTVREIQKAGRSQPATNQPFYGSTRWKYSMRRSSPNTYGQRVGRAETKLVQGVRRTSSLPEPNDRHWHTAWAHIRNSIDGRDIGCRPHRLEPIGSPHTNHGNPGSHADFERIVGPVAARTPAPGGGG